MTHQESSQMYMKQSLLHLKLIYNCHLPSNLEEDIHNKYKKMKELKKKKNKFFH